MEEIVFGSKGVDKLVDQKEVAKLLGVSVKTVECWRWQKKGPKYIKLGRLARYRMSDVMKFIQGLVKEVQTQSC